MNRFPMSLEKSIFELTEVATIKWYVHSKSVEIKHPTIVRMQEQRQT